MSDFSKFHVLKNWTQLSLSLNVRTTTVKWVSYHQAVSSSCVVVNLSTYSLKQSRSIILVQKIYANLTSLYLDWISNTFSRLKVDELKELREVCEVLKSFR